MLIKTPSLNPAIINLFANSVAKLAKSCEEWNIFPKLGISPSELFDVKARSTSPKSIDFETTISPFLNSFSIPCPIPTLITSNTSYLTIKYEVIALET